jgi:MFS family permease
MWVLGLVVLMDNVDQSVIRGMVQPLEHAFGVGDFAIGVLASAFVLVNGLVTVPAGYLGDRVHRTHLIGRTMAGWSVLSALGGAMPTFPLLVGARGLLGFGQGVSDPAANSLIADFYDLGRRGTAFSVQYCMTFVGFGAGAALGTVISSPVNSSNWRWAFVVSALPGLLVAVLVYRLTEPRRGAADRAHVGVADETGVGSPTRTPLFEEGVGRFLVDMVRGLRTDTRTILKIPTMRYALVGVSFILFTVTALSFWLPTFYQRQLHLSASRATALFVALAVGAGVSGVLLGGRLADRLTDRIRGARMAIPGFCLVICLTCFLVSYLWLPVAPTFALEFVGFFAASMSIPALRAGLSDAVPAHVRGTGFGAFNLFSVIFGTAAAPSAVGLLSDLFGHDLRTALILVTPPAYIGAWLLLRARDHIERDTAAIFTAVIEAVQADQARTAEREGPAEAG